MSTLNRLDRQKFVVWRRPLTTLLYCFLELVYKCAELMQWMWRQRALLYLPLLGAISMIVLYFTDGPHQQTMARFEQHVLRCAYWTGLGILSSVGLGTGLHTFILYLGPFIASVTLAAYECNSLSFPEPPYPNEIICPPNSTSTSNMASTVAVSMWAIMSKVRWEAFMWGAGTALGELPPYFMARTARLSGEEPDNEEYRDFLQFLAAQEGPTDGKPGLWDRAKQQVERLVTSAGFFGILLCASIPNPLFDLAGITCGHFGVPFWTFVSATLIGKAVIKMHIQKMFVIVAFSEHHVDKYVAALSRVPYVGRSLQAPFKEFLRKQKASLHSVGAHETKTSRLQEVFGYVVLAMVIYFLVSIVNSMAQAYHARLWERQRKEIQQHKSD